MSRATLRPGLPVCPPAGASWPQRVGRGGEGFGEPRVTMGKSSLPGAQRPYLCCQAFCSTLGVK